MIKPLRLIQIESAVPVLMTSDGEALLDEQIAETSMWDTFSDQYDLIVSLVNRYFEKLNGVAPPCTEFYLVLKSWLEDHGEGFIYCCEILGELDYNKLALAVQP